MTRGKDGAIKNIFLCYSPKQTTMTKEKMIDYFLFFKGEKECPFERGSTKARLWVAEQFCHDNPHLISDSNPADDIFSYVEAYVGKWDPYGWVDVMNFYIMTRDERHGSK